ncbi:arfaptin-2-like [Tubulanus polymorphus]|uniref:arfaptin-2-like n=1 Tax=Tubulanus polymorphus TaxID=672921 RepID=UPI003DA6070F
MTEVRGQITNGNQEDEDTFEQDLHDMLKDAPNLDLNSSNVLSGNQRTTTYSKDDSSPRIPSSLPQTSIPRSYSVPPATTNVPLASPQRNGDGNNAGNAGSGRAKALISNSATKLEVWKAWGINTYKCTRQMISEKLGKGSRTVDLELESQIEVLRDTQRKYANILRLARALTSHFFHVVQTQRALGESFSDMSQKSPELQDEFTYNAETQRALCKNGETLLGAMNFFTSGVNTLCNKTMEDTLTTVKQYETARIEYDAYRADLEALNLGPRDAFNQPRIEEAQRKFHAHKEKFDRLRADVGIKLKFLEENKVKVMHKQLLLFHNAVSAYFSGNQTELEATLKRFNIKLKQPNAGKPSWIEQ